MDLTDIKKHVKLSDLQLSMIDEIESANHLTKIDLITRCATVYYQNQSCDNDQQTNANKKDSFCEIFENDLNDLIDSNEIVAIKYVVPNYPDKVKMLLFPKETKFLE